MVNYINTYSDMAAYNADSTKQYPNVSYIIATDEVVWAKDDPALLRRVVCTYNVPSTSSAKKLLNETTGITKQIIDGVVQSEVVKNYTFDTTGEHVVEYEFLNNEIGQTTFLYCPNLATVTIGDAVTSIGSNAFMQCANLTSITIPDSVTSIEHAAFYQCSSLTSITIPDSVTSISDQTFLGCSSLANVTIGDAVTSIGLAAFQNCTNLTSINIPDSVTSIDNSAFLGCSSLANVTVEATTPPTLGFNAFTNNASGRKIYVPAASVSTYQSASRWSDYANDIEPIS